MTMNRETDSLLQAGIAALRGGDKREGARILAQVVRKEPQSEEAWFWLATAAEQPAEAQACLRRVLQINPGNTRAQQAMQMLDAGQGIASLNPSASPAVGFATEPLGSPTPAMQFNRALNTGELLAPPGMPDPAPPPPVPVYANTASTIEAPSPFSTPNWAQGEAGATPPPFDPYGGPQLAGSNVPPPPPPPSFANAPGGTVRLGQLDPNATAVAPPPMPMNFSDDPGAMLRANLLPQEQQNYVANAATIRNQKNVNVKSKNRKNEAVPPKPVKVETKKRNSLLPILLLAVGIAVLALAALFALTRPATEQVALQSATAEVAGTGTAISITGGATSGVAGTSAAGTLAPGSSGTTGTGGTAGAAGTSVAGSLAPGVGGTSAAGTSAAGTSGAGLPGNTVSAAGAGAGTLPPRTTPAAGAATATGTTSTGLVPPAGGITVGQATVVAGPTPTPRLTPLAPISTPGGSTGTTQPAGNTTPGGVTPGGVSNQTPATDRDNQPPPEVQRYVDSLKLYTAYGKFFETSIGEGVVKPFRDGKIKAGTTRINFPPQPPPPDLNPTTSASGTTPATTVSSVNVPVATSRPVTTTAPVTTTPPATTADPGSDVVTSDTTAAATTAAATTAAATSAAATTPAAGGSAATSVTPLASIPSAGSFRVIIQRPSGPRYYFYDVYYDGPIELSQLSLSMGQTARVIKDVPPPSGAYEVHQIALEYASDLTNMSNALDQFFATGQLRYLDELANYYDKAVRDRERWENIVIAGYPYRVSL